jgi:hyperosmotically inducible protein
MKLGIVSPLASIALCLCIGACDKDTAVGTTHTTSGQAPTSSDQTPQTPTENTRANEQDNPAGASAGMAPTPLDQAPLNQGSASSDAAIAAQIRQALLADDTLSVEAKNVRVTAVNGVVTLRGPVKSDAEQARVDAKVSAMAGASRVDDQITIEKMQ